MTQLFNVLIVEDHPIIAETYKNILSGLTDNSNSYQFNIDIAYNADSALHKINTALKSTLYDLILLDISIPPSEDKKIMSGEDLGILIRKKSLDVKIIVITAFNDNFRLNNILKSFKPNAILVKTDIDFNILNGAIKTVLKGSPSYSMTVMNLIRNQMSYDFVLDNKDRIILYQLSIGTRMKELARIVPLSIPGLERRKYRLIEAFNVVNQNDRALVDKAQEAGFV